MPEGMYRIGIVGASSLAGKELADELNESLLAASDFILLEEEDEVAGQVTAAAGEAAFIQKIVPGSFDGMDFVFFAGAPEDATNHWQAARRAGASIVDMTCALEQEPDVLIRAPWVSEALQTSGSTSGSTSGPDARSGRPDLRTPAVVAAHPAAVILALIAARIAAKLPLASLAATVLEPASQHGREAMDELHQQTVNLLSFQTLPREQFDAQVSFNLLPALGASAKAGLAATERRIRRHYAAISAGRLPELALQLVQAPVFHGYAISLLVELQSPATIADLEASLAGDHIDLVTDGSDPPSNVSAAGQEDIMTRIRAAGGTRATTRFWLWLAADNLKFAALNAITCANELRRMRPRGKVQ